MLQGAREGCFWLLHDASVWCECRAAENIGMVTWYLLLGGANAVLYNITHYRVIQITSATATPVIGDSSDC